MSIDTFWWYGLASVLLLVAHVFRAARWALLFPERQVYRRFDLLLGLAVGYGINSMIPWRLGELARIWFVAGMTSARVSYVAATVVAERLADLVAVAAITAFIAYALQPAAWPLPVALVLLACSLVLLSFLVQKSHQVRLVVWRVASLFNNRIRFLWLDFFWSLSELVVHGALVKWRFLVTTALMWAIYLLSYLTFARTAQVSVADMVFAMLGSAMQSATERLDIGGSPAGFALIGFTLFPILVILLYGALKQLPAIFRLLAARRRYGWFVNRGLHKSIQSHYHGEGEYEYFLVSLFSAPKTLATTFGLVAIDDAKVHKVFAGGSDAIAAMVEVRERLLIRKFAVGASGHKLKAQRDWLALHRQGGFPLVDIIGECIKPECYYYDMPLVVPANDFYDFIHTHPIEGSKRIFSEVLDCVSSFHARNQGPAADGALVRRYLLEKAVGNARAILDFARTVFSNDYRINDGHYRLEQWDRLLDIDWLCRQVSSRATTVVHGDLTIENIIVAPERQPNWYIIDPNPDNVFNSSLIDWSKLMQSVHLGYEGLNRNFSCAVNPDSVQLVFTKSQAYTELHLLLERLATDRLGQDGLREVYFHELINYLRLTPYKIRRDPLKGICFFCCTSILLGRYLQKAI